MLTLARASIFGWLAVPLLIAAAPPASAADYPSRPVKIITQAAAGSGPDVTARIVADKLASRLGQQVVVMNRPGAGGLIAAKAAAEVDPDGYTLYLASGSALTVLPVTHPDLPFSFERDFVPIGMLGQQPMLIAASPQLGVQSLGELIALAKKRPGELFYAGNTPGTVPSLTGEMLKQRAGIDLSFVPYPGFAAALKDLIGGRISVVIESPAAMSGAIQSGSAKLLAVASAKRMAQFPNVPTAAETLPGFEATGWFALFARAGTPETVVQKLSRDLRAALDDRELREKLAKFGTDATKMSPAELRAFILREQKAWLPVIRQAGLKAE
jgi:tripartite-type tricarboxylate transporter receptor subunit TctC